MRGHVEWVQASSGFVRTSRLPRTNGKRAVPTSRVAGFGSTKTRVFATAKLTKEVAHVGKVIVLLWNPQLESDKNAAS